MVQTRCMLHGAPIPAHMLPLQYSRVMQHVVAAPDPEYEAGLQVWSGSRTSPIVSVWPAGLNEFDALAIV